METTTTTITTAGINLVRQPTDLEISKAECAPPLTQHQQIEKKDKGRDKGEHDILNTYQQYNKDNITQDIISPTTVITTPADERPEPTLTRHKSNHTRCSKMFFIKSDDESEGGQKQQQHHDRSLPRTSFRLPPHPPPAAAGPPTVTPHQQHVKESLQRTSSISSSLGSITDYDSDFDDDDDNEDDDDDQEDDPLFPSNDGPRIADSFHKKPTLLKHQRSLLSDMLSHKATTAVSKSRPIPPPSAATTIRPPSADPFMTKELSESLRRNVQWEQSQKRLCYFKYRTAAPPLKPDNPSLTDDEFQAMQVTPFPEARNPAWKLKVDLGPETGIKKSSAQITTYTAEELVGTQVMAVVNFKPRQIGKYMSEDLVLGVNNTEGNAMLVRPDRDVPLGGRLA
ncbi:hypothetical protein Unana1_07839 [Umbelopsis nana]